MGEYTVQCVHSKSSIFQNYGADSACVYAMATPKLPKVTIALSELLCVVIPKGLNDGQGLWGNELFQIAMNNFEFCSIIQSWGKIFQTWKQDRRVWFTSHLPLPFLATL